MENHCSVEDVDEEDPHERGTIVASFTRCGDEQPGPLRTKDLEVDGLPLLETKLSSLFCGLDMNKQLCHGTELDPNLNMWMHSNW